jgi:hypothetical protein
MKNRILIILLFSFAFAKVFSQTDRNATIINSEKNGWMYELKAGINIGGASPLPLPVEIRSIDKYNPGFNGSIEGVATHWLGIQKKWGISVGLKLESKGMTTGATVKNYSMEIIDGGNKVSGYWTGYVHTKYATSMFTLPVNVNYNFNNRWKLHAGVFASLLFNKEFSGYVCDGYLREGTPIGQKLEFTGDKTATYDFDHNLQSFQWGLQAGASWLAFRRFSLNADLSWGMNNIFKSDFKTITFKMHPIFFNIGFGYLF